MRYIFRFSSPRDGRGSNIHRFNQEDNIQNGMTPKKTSSSSVQEEQDGSRQRTVATKSETLALITGCSFLANSIMEKTEPGMTSFNDFKFYDDLCRQDGCTNVDISSIRVRHNDFCHGFQVQYRCTFQDKDGSSHSTRLVWAKSHFFQRGFYAYHGSKSRQEVTWVLDEDEYITGLRIQQGEIVDSITFVTNLRQLHAGGNGGTAIDMMPPTGTHTRVLPCRIVAFTGTEHGVLHRVGYIAKPFGWSIIRHFAMLRWLKQRGRAIHKNGDASVTNALVDLGEDGIFRCILEYLV